MRRLKPEVKEHMKDFTKEHLPTFLLVMVVYTFLMWFFATGQDGMGVGM